MAAHTPIPWEAVRHDEDALNVSGWRIRLVGAKLCEIAFVGDAEYGEEVAAANAAFIVRAVNAHDDLIAACEAALNELPSEEQCYDDEELRVVRLVKAALAKARGTK